MKKIFIISALFLSISAAFTACGNKENNTEQNGQTAEYTCPMHPEVKSDKPGKCPKCGMDLEKVEK